MSRVLLHFCDACNDYTLQEACPRCGATARPNRPPKYSPEDRWGAYRRQAKRQEQAKQQSGS